jgi:hypothetical protein
MITQTPSSHAATSAPTVRVQRRAQQAGVQQQQREQQQLQLVGTKQQLRRRGQQQKQQQSSSSYSNSRRLWPWKAELLQRDQGSRMAAAAAADAGAAGKFHLEPCVHVDCYNYCCSSVCHSFEGVFV